MNAEKRNKQDSKQTSREQNNSSSSSLLPHMYIMHDLTDTFYVTVLPILNCIHFIIQPSSGLDWHADYLTIQKDGSSPFNGITYFDYFLLDSHVKYLSKPG